MRYTREDGCRAWLTYGDIPAATLKKLLEDYGSAEAIYDAFLKKGPPILSAYAGHTQLKTLARQAVREAMHAMMLKLQAMNAGILSLTDAAYPDALRDIPDSPVFLFYRGNLDITLGKCITIIGSRRASPSGLQATRTIARELSENGVHIVSGMAMGIDAAALEGGMNGGTPVIGVMGCGLDLAYPLENEPIKTRLLEQGGLLLSEYPPGSPALPWHFPIRNRIMSGLSQAVLMMEGRIRSGTMVTVQHALDQGKEVYAYPGEASTEYAEGAHQLLREGANYFTCAQDVLEDMNWPREEPKQVLKQPASMLPQLTPEQRKICAVLRQGEMSFDQLAAATELTSPALSGALTMLQLMGLIQSLPGKTYRKV